jgi:hypothetical protein
LVERGAGVSAAQRGGDKRQVVDDVAIEERLLLGWLVGAGDADFVAVNADILGVQFIRYAESPGELDGEATEIGPGERGLV